MAQSFDTTVGLTANASSAGQPIDFDGRYVSGLVIQNNSGVSIQYTVDGASWVTLANGASANPFVSVPSAFRIRKATSDSYPVPVRLAWCSADSRSGVALPILASTQSIGKVWNSFVPGLAYCGPTNTLPSFTMSTMIALDSEFDAVRIPLVNFDTANSQTYDAVSVSVVGSAADPVNGSGSWTVAQFSGATSVTLPAATAVSGRIQPTIALSDPIYIQSTPRTDGGTKPLICVRVYMSGPAAGTKMMSYWAFGAGGGAGGFAVNADGRVWLSYRASGDFASANHSGMTTANSGPERGYSPVPGVVYRSRTPYSASIVCIGDSITRGSNANQYGMAWTYKLMQALSSSSYPVTTVNAGVSGATSAEFVTIAGNTLAKFPATHAIFPAWTPNDASPSTITPALIATMRTNLVKFLDLCTTYRVVPIIWKGTPRSTDATTNPPVSYYPLTDSLRTDWVNSVAASYGAVVVDTLTDLSTAGTPAAFKYGYTVEGLHPNDTADTLIANAMAAGISPYLGPLANYAD